MLKSIRESLVSLKSKRVQQKNQSRSESVNGVDICIEESKQDSNCGPSIEDGRKSDDAEGNSSFAHTIINMAGMLIGLGQLSTPFALENGGWASASLLIGLGIMNAYSSHLLGKCLEKNPRLRSYVDIGNEAFGRKGRLLAATFIYMEIFMALVSYTISLHDNLVTVFMGAHLKLHLAKLSSSQLLTIMAVLIAVPSLWLKDISFISFLSTGGVLMSILIFSTVVLTPIFGDVKLNQKIPVLQLHNIPLISGLYMFNFSGHVVFPDIYKSMKEPSKFTKVSIVSFSIATALYTTLGFMGSKMFGPQVKSQVTLSMPRKFVVTKIALWASVLTPITKYALEFVPFALQLHRWLPSSMSSRTKIIIRGTVCLVILLVILVLALSVPYFEYVLSLTGCLLSVVISLIFPSAFYMKICWGQIQKPLLVLNFSIITFGFVIGVMGTISSSTSLLKTLQGAH